MANDAATGVLDAPKTDPAPAAASPPPAATPPASAPPPVATPPADKAADKAPAASATGDKGEPPKGITDKPSTVVSGEKTASSILGGDTPPPPASSGAGTPAFLAEMAKDENWRTRLASELTGDEKQQKAFSEKLARMQSPMDLVRSALEADRKISEITKAQEGMVKVPGEKATDEERAAFRKALGAPETADAYNVDLGQGYVANPVDEIVVKDLKSLALKHALSQAAVNDLVSLQRNGTAKMESFIKARAAQHGEEAVRNYQTEYGVEWDAKRNAVRQLTQDRFGQDWTLINQAVLPDGRPLLSVPSIFRGFASMSDDYIGGGAMISGSGMAGKTAEARLAELQGLMHTDRKKYQSAEVQKELRELAGHIAADERRAGARR